jgi:hypothetical protein
MREYFAVCVAVIVPLAVAERLSVGVILVCVEEERHSVGVMAASQGSAVAAEASRAASCSVAAGFGGIAVAVAAG